MTDITMTKEGGFYYRALSFHWVFVAAVFPFATIAIVLAVINPFWFREDMFRWIENRVNRLARWRDKIKYRLYLGADPAVWHALKD
jgi:hypothetical protein